MKNIFKKVFNNTKETKISTNPTLKEMNEFFDTDLLEINGSELNSATYYACMDIRCKALAKLPIGIYKETKKGKEKYFEHPVYKLLKIRPNPYTTPHDFLWATEFQRLEYGNAFWVKDIDSRGSIKGLYLLDSTRVKIMINSSVANNKSFIKNIDKYFYIYDDPRYGEIIYKSNQIAHFKNFSSNGLKGTSIKKYLSETINNEKFARCIITDKYKNGLQDPIIVEYIGDLKEAKQQKIIKKFQSLGGVKNAGKVVPIPTDFRVSQLETKLVNSQFFQLQELTEKQIMNAFGVKAFQLNNLSKSSYTNIEQQNKAFYCDTLQNALTQYEQEIDYKIIGVEDDLICYSKFNVDSILRSDLATRSAAYATAITTGWMSIEEVRDKEDLPFIEGTESLIIGNGASIPLSDLGKQYTKGGDEK